MRKEKCEDCRWWVDQPHEDKFGTVVWRGITGALSEEHWGLCCLFPNLTWKIADAFCGQWKEKNNE